MARKRVSAEEVLAQVLESDDEELDESDYGHDSDFESENESESGASDGDSSGDDVHDAQPVLHAQGPPPPPAARGRPARGRGRGGGIRRAPDMVIPPPLTRDTARFTATDFNPRRDPGPTAIPDNINDESTPLQFFSLFWDDVLWELLATETNRQAAHLKTAKPNNYVAKNWTDCTVIEIKAFFGRRVAMEMLIHKDRYEQYWKVKKNMLTVTPGFPKVFCRDRFLAIWSVLHCVDEQDPALDKTDKIYKSRPIFNYILERFKRHYTPEQELSLDEGMIPTKNSLSIRQYIKDKPIKWGIKTFLLTDSENGFIIDAEVYTGYADNITRQVVKLVESGQTFTLDEDPPSLCAKYERPASKDQAIAEHHAHARFRQSNTK
ncbi:piggyBac transposable element-derived protein 4-like [Lineus longissimus]|uniref:piggyBac transposable element-derived protein 4-like n=1 Tax=Lineus longissimus TaxID=88925 RepID=UPI00315CF859